LCHSAPPRSRVRNPEANRFLWLSRLLSVGWWRQVAGGSESARPTQSRFSTTAYFLIEGTTLQRPFHKAKKHEANPVFQPEPKHKLAESTLGEP
jgi:hypothetical protein